MTARRNISGWKPDRPDHRDRLFEVNPKATLPARVDLSQFCPPVEDQGPLGSCTAHAGTSALEFLYRRLGQPMPQLSRLFLYYATRVWVEGDDPDDDAGAYNRDVAKALQRYGVCLETLQPYQPLLYGLEPSDRALADAANRQITEYRRCTSLTAIKQCLADGFPLSGGFSVPENMMSQYAELTGIVQYPGPLEPIIGGHAVMFVGYNNSTKLLKFQNSWSRDWGEGGYGYLPYDFVTYGLADDFWTVRNAETGGTSIVPVDVGRSFWASIVNFFKRLF